MVFLLKGDAQYQRTMKTVFKSIKATFAGFIGTCFTKPIDVYDTESEQTNEFVEISSYTWVTLTGEQIQWDVSKCDTMFDDSIEDEPPAHIDLSMVCYVPPGDSDSVTDVYSSTSESEIISISESGDSFEVHHDLMSSCASSEADSSEYHSASDDENGVRDDDENSVPFALKFKVGPQIYQVWGKMASMYITVVE
jgi:hypothetical protein